jgi:TonB family protein
MALSRRAADTGIAASQVNVGFMYESGLGVNQDYAAAMAWYRKAADQGNAQAENNIGNLYAKGLGVHQDDAEAISWFRKAVAKGNGNAVNNLLSLHRQGRIPSDASEGTLPAGLMTEVCSEKTPPPCASAPQVISVRDPEYSKQAREAKYQGTCMLGLVVGTDGSTSHIFVISGLGMGLDEKAIEAVKTWRFKPAMKDGRPVPMQLAVEVDFHLY